MEIQHLKKRSTGHLIYIERPLCEKRWGVNEHLSFRSDANMPKIVDHKKYKRTLLEKARVIFSTKNYADVSMRDVAQSLGVSTGTLYHYFPSKEDLFCDLFLHSAQLSAGQLVDALCTLNGRRAKLDRLLGFFRSQCDGMRMQFLFSADMVRNDMPPKAVSLLRRWSHELNRRLAAILGVDAATGSMIFYFLSGSIYARVIMGDDKQIEPAFAAFERMLDATILLGENDNTRGKK